MVVAWALLPLSLRWSDEAKNRDAEWDAEKSLEKMKKNLE